MGTKRRGRPEGGELALSFLLTLHRAKFAEELFTGSHQLDCVLGVRGGGWGRPRTWCGPRPCSAPPGGLRLAPVYVWTYKSALVTLKYFCRSTLITWVLRKLDFKFNKSLELGKTKPLCKTSCKNCNPIFSYLTHLVILCHSYKYLSYCIKTN